MTTETNSQTFQLSGMDCAACARTIEKGVAGLDQVAGCQVNFGAETLAVDSALPAEAIVERVRALGYDATVGAGARPVTATTQSFWQYMGQRSDTRLILLGFLLILPGLLFNELLPFLGIESPLFAITSVAAMLAAGGPIYRSAWRALRFNREININVLMSIASIGAVAIGAYSEAGLVMVLFALGEALEGYTTGRARHSIRQLMTLAPQSAIALRPCLDCAGHMGQDGYEGGPCPFCGLEEVKVPVDELIVGDTIIVRPGERIPMDGVVITGHSAVNQAPITGESRLITKEPGAEVYASSINGDGALQIEVTHLAADNTISRLIKLVEEAQAGQAPTQRWVDRFAQYYTPAVVLLALLVAAIPPLFFDAPFLSSGGEQGWLYRGLALLVVACPCALVISTPVTIISAISRAARAGVLIKGGAFLEALSGVKAIAFDKTGTLTTGRPTVTAARALDCSPVPAGERCAACDDLLAVAGALEQRSAHPLAHAIITESAARGVLNRYPAAAAVQALTGRGVRGEVDGEPVFIGSHASFDNDIPHPAEHCALVRDAADQGQTPMLVQRGSHYHGFITVADVIRPESTTTLKALRQLGIRHLTMLTGDDEATARRLGAALPLDEVRARLLPAQKMAAIDELRAQFGPVAMIGDGVNDAPALARADVGIAMGAAGSAQALETADIALMSDDLSRLPFAIRLSQAARRAIQVNIFLSLAIKAAFLLLVLAGTGSLWLAVLADVGTSLLVTMNGMRLGRFNN